MINIFSIYKKLKRSYSKNVPELVALRNRLYPEFVFEANPETLKDEMPVFTLHSVEPCRFEEQLKFLSVNSYQTLTADEFYECLTGSKPIPERAILLTFDDGWKSLWTVAYPLLRKYRLHAVCFIIPGLICDGDKGDPAHFDASEPLCNWHEIKEMHEDGVVDFQPHSLYHNLIFTSDTIEDFIYPSFDSYANNFNVPLFRTKGEENVHRDAELGTPVYKHAPRFSGQKRYFDDEDLRNQCIEYVRLNGGDNFFRNYNWRKKLMNLIQDYRKKHGNSGYFESEEEMKANLYNDLLESKLMIETRLPGKTVSHFCYPWWEGSDLAVDMSRKAGYLTNFWGILTERRTNRCGDDPYRVARLLSDDYIYRLPGEGRKSLFKIIEEKASLNYKGFIRRVARID